MSLGKRLLKILSLVKPCNIVADVGCDHGKIGTELVLQNICKHCIFSDISELSLNKAKVLSIEKGFYRKCKFIVCDGLSGYSASDKLDYVIIAGMGGIEISNIISKAPKNITVDKFILQPNNNVVYLRRMLVSNGFKVLSDEVVDEQGMFYNVLLVEKGADVLTNDELEFGRTNLYNLSPDFLKYLEFKLNKLEIILKNVKGTEKAEEITNLIYQIKKYLKGRKIKCNKK